MNVAPVCSLIPKLSVVVTVHVYGLSLYFSPVTQGYNPVKQAPPLVNCMYLIATIVSRPNLEKAVDLLLAQESITVKHFMLVSSLSHPHLS